MAAVMSSEYWCHQCNRTIVPIMGDEICCPRCNGGFVEEVETPPQRQAEQSVGGFMDPGLTALLGGSGLRGEAQGDESSAEGPQRMMVVGQAPLMLHMMHALGSALAGMHLNEAAGREENGGVVVVDPMGFPMFILQGANGAGAAQVPGALGDYFLGSGLEMLLQRLAENDPNRYGTLPTAKEAVEALPTVKISDEHLKCERSSECAVCKEDFTDGEETRQLPCKHLYHPDCILPWLKLHSSCPVCRFQMPTDEEESGKGQSEESTSDNNDNNNNNNNNNGGDRNEGNDNNNNNGWFRVSLPFSMISNLVSSALGNGNGNNNNTNTNTNTNQEGSNSDHI